MEVERGGDQKDGDGQKEKSKGEVLHQKTLLADLAESIAYSTAARRAREAPTRCTAERV
jgi:hypothetical protein